MLHRTISWHRHKGNSHMLYQIYETQRSIMEPFSDLAQAAAKLYSNPLSPISQLSLIHI